MEAVRPPGKSRAAELFAAMLSMSAGAMPGFPIGPAELELPEKDTHNAAQQILASLNVYGAMMGTRANYRGPTPPKFMRKGEDGLRRPGRYGKGLRNWITRKQAQERA